MRVESLSATADFVKESNTGKLITESIWNHHSPINSFFFPPSANQHTSKPVYSPFATIKSVFIEESEAFSTVRQGKQEKAGNSKNERK